MASLENAPHIDEQLSAYLDGELSEQERQQVEAHLKTCPSCRADYEQLRRVAELASEGLRSVRCLSPADRAAYIHGLLDDERCRATEEHLARCKRCREEVDQLRQWIEDDPALAAETADGRGIPARRRDSRHLANYAAVFLPLAAAAAIIVVFASLLTTVPGISPSIESMNVCATMTRDGDQQEDVQVAFGTSFGLHTNDQIQLAVQAGVNRYATVFMVDSHSEVQAAVFGPFDGRVTLPSAETRWRLGAFTGTDALLIALSRNPLDAALVESARQVLAKHGPLPVLSYGSVLWLDQKGHWASEKPVSSTASLDSLAATLRQALPSNVACRGVAFAHE